MGQARQSRQAALTQAQVHHPPWPLTQAQAALTQAQAALTQAQAALTGPLLGHVATPACLHQRHLLQQQQNDAGNCDPARERSSSGCSVHRKRRRKTSQHAFTAALCCHLSRANVELILSIGWGNSLSLSLSLYLCLSLCLSLSLSLSLSLCFLNCLGGLSRICGAFGGLSISLFLYLSLSISLSLNMTIFCLQ